MEEGNVEKGFNSANGTYVNLKENGIVDPTKVVRTALVHSGSVASLMLTTECMIFDEPEAKKEWSMYHIIHLLILFNKNTLLKK